MIVTLDRLCTHKAGSVSGLGLSGQPFSGAVALAADDAHALDERGVKYTDYDVSRDQAAAQEMVSLTGQMGVPVIVAGGEVIIGFDRPRLEAILARGNGRGRPRLGMKVADAANRPRKPGEPPIFGALVGAVEAASPAAGTGIKPGDVITELDGTRVNNAGELGDITRGADGLPCG